MAFNQELKDFLGGWSATQKVFSGYDDAAYKKRKAKLLDAQTSLTEQKTKDAADPELRKLKIEGTRSLINSRNSQNSYRDWLRTYQPQTPQAPAAIPVPQNVYPQDEEVPAPAQTSYLDEGYESTQFAQSGGPIEEALDNNARRQRERFAIPATSDDDEEYRRSVEEMRRQADVISAQQVQDENAKRRPRRGTKGYKQGGLVKAYDEGGLVSDDGDEDDEDPGVSYAAAFDAAREGLGFAQAQAQPQAQPRPAAQPQPRQAIPMQQPQPPAPRGMAQRQPRGQQAAPLEQVQQVEQAIDPKGKMSPAKRKMAALSTVYQFYLDKDPNRAKSAAASLLQHYEMAASRYSALAAVAAEKGDVNGALKAMVKAYENIPDGVEFKVTRAGDKFNYDFVDSETGKTFRRGVMTPDEILGAAMKMPQQGVAQFVARAAGRKLAGEKPAEKPKALSVRDRGTVRTAVGEELKSTTDIEGGKPRYEIAPGQEDALANVATQIQGDNPRLSVKDSATIAQGLIYGRAKPAKVVKVNEDGSRVVRPFGDDDEREVTVSRDAWLQSYALKKKNKETVLEEDTTKAVETFKRDSAAMERDLARNKVKTEHTAEKRRRAESVRQQRTAMGAQNDTMPTAVAVNEEE